MAVDWNKIETEYITTDISQRDIAKKYGIAYSTLQRHCNKGQWYARRKERDSKVKAKAVQESIVKEAAALAVELDTANQLVKLIADAIDSKTFEAHNAMGEIVEDSKDTKKILEAANALSKLTSLKRVIEGTYNKKELDAYNLALRKANLEEKKAAADDIKDNKIEIVLPEQAEDWIV